MIKHFIKHNIQDKVTRIYAPAPPSNMFLPNMLKSGQYGCTMSHLKALGHALQHAEGHVLIIEDDISFNANAEYFARIINWMRKNEWDIFYFGGQPQKKVSRVSENIYAMNNTKGTYGYVINYAKLHTLYDFFIDSLMSCENNTDGICDYILGSFSKAYISRGAYPLLTIPAPTYSIIQNKDVDHRELVENRWERCL